MSALVVSLRRFARWLRRTTRRLTSRAFVPIIVGRGRLHVARVRRDRMKAARAGRILRVLVYSPVDLNVIDGSSIWVESVVATLTAGPNVWVTLPLMAREKRTILTDALRALPRVQVTPSGANERGTAQRLDVRGALDWIERLDEASAFDVVLLRGFDLCLAAAARARFAGKLWSAYILEPERDTEAPNYQSDMGVIAAASRYILTQTVEMRTALEDRVPAARGRTIVLSPAVPDATPRAPRTSVHRLIYTGKFSPFYPVPDLIDAFVNLKAEFPDLAFDLVGDKVLRSEPEYAEALRTRVGSVDGLHWHGGMSRSDVGRLLAGGGIALSVWDYRYGTHWNDLVVSTKLLDYCAAGLPVVLTRTTVQADILGHDYPLFVSDPTTAEDTIRRVLKDPVLYADAADRCWQAARAFTYEAVFGRLAPYLSTTVRDPGGRDPDSPGSFDS